MATIIASRDSVFVSNGLKLLIMNFKRDTYEVLDISESVLPEEQKLVKDIQPKILCTEISPCGRFLALADDYKRLMVWETEGMKLKYQAKVETRVTRIAFTPDSNKVITADKSGDSFLHNFLAQKEELLLGHLSMLTGVSLSQDGSRIITSDRDEKIRISRFPNAYNIIGFCLGHENFVTNFKLCRGDKLISSSGDGTLRLWNYLQGTQLSAVSPLKDIQLEAEMDQELAIADLEVLESDNSELFVVAIIEKISTLVCYKVFEDVLTFASSIELPEPCIDLTVDPLGHIWTLCKSGCHVLQLKGGKLELNADPAMGDLIQRATKDSILKEMGDHEDRFIQLRKRILDNTMEYLKRKEERLSKEVQQPEVKKTKSS
eukprot:TRINITY_DN1526_c0_g1_i1.p1 TRINITY_DN1526_c0_g1~~TRINITY_DN1526_c0_g1_i1.p1  ORF type:complete len:375 (-),score=55.40 TRINITY_DN1526_c0_g1_i1:270-1394(-)